MSPIPMFPVFPSYLLRVLFGFCAVITAQNPKETKTRPEENQKNTKRK